MTLNKTVLTNDAAPLPYREDWMHRYPVDIWRREVAEGRSLKSYDDWACDQWEADYDNREFELVLNPDEAYLLYNHMYAISLVDEHAFGDLAKNIVEQLKDVLTE